MKILIMVENDPFPVYSAYPLQDDDDGVEVEDDFYLRYRSARDEFYKMQRELSDLLGE